MTFTTAPQDTTVIFVPGAWHSPDCYEDVIFHLHKAGYSTSKVYTPSVLRDGMPPVENFDPDVQDIRKHLKQATDAGQKVVLVAHSYGGVPGSEALRSFDQATFASQGHTDGRGVIHVVYLAAFMLRCGESLVQKAKVRISETREDGSSWPLDPIYSFYQDFESKDKADRWVAELRPWSASPILGLLSYEPWRIIPTTYLVCENDNAIPAADQREFVSKAIEAGAVDMRMISWNCGHTPFGVNPLGISHIIRNAVGDVVASPATSEKNTSQITQVELVETQL